MSKRYWPAIGDSPLPHSYGTKEDAIMEARRVCRALHDAGVRGPFIIRWESVFDPPVIGARTAPDVTADRPESGREVYWPMMENALQSPIKR